MMLCSTQDQIYGAGGWQEVKQPAAKVQEEGDKKLSIYILAVLLAIAILSSGGDKENDNPSR